MKVIKAPNSYNKFQRPWVFLAGSIDMGKAVDWQTKCTEFLKNRFGTILNPRRADWDSTWEQSIDNSKFSEQVVWELEALDNADIILLYFDSKSSAPITLLEFGLHAKDNKLVVCCQDGFYRKGNVDIVCRQYGINQVKTLKELAGLVSRMH